MNAYQWVIRGRVQGVGYRNACAKKAASLSLKGTVQNLLSGEVQVEVEGPIDAINVLRAWCKKGPLWARVDSIEETPIEPRGFQEFLIVR